MSALALSENPTKQHKNTTANAARALIQCCFSVLVRLLPNAAFSPQRTA